MTVPAETLAGRTGPVAIGIRPEKLRPEADEPNKISGVITESAYIGVSTQYVIETASGSVSIYVQNERGRDRGPPSGRACDARLEPRMHLCRRPAGGPR